MGGQPAGGGGPRTVTLRAARFAAVGVATTVVDVAALVTLRLGAGLPVLLADALAIVAASAFSFSLRRNLDSPEDPYSRAVGDTGVFVVLAVVSGFIDVALLRLLAAAAGSQVDTAGALLAAKAPALAAAAALRLAVYRRILFSRVRDELFESLPRAAAVGDRRVSVVIPAFREVARIAATIERIRSALRPALGEVEVVVVDDGSGDGTAAAARAAGADQAVVLDPNRGKGAAVRAGMLAARGSVVAFIDADLAYPPEQIARLVARVEEGFDVVVGSRRHVDTTTLVKNRRVREVSGRLFNLFTTVVLLGQYRDTQCGIKAFRADAAQEIFRSTRIDGFAFDVEVFHLAERFRLRVSEVPVELANSEVSSVRVGRDALRMMRDLLRIRWWALVGGYDAGAGAGPARR